MMSQRGYPILVISGAGHGPLSCPSDPAAGPYAFLQEHRRCGVLDADVAEVLAGVDDVHVWRRDSTLRRRRMITSVAQWSRVAVSIRCGPFNRCHKSRL
jgi:hypothetical protein